ncbi:MAG: TetR/AcrR family transcriptional regulator [Bacilli bacterium]|nr:TetR/AcrR family transcriptional regulator [Bacilli bacterium]
MRYKKEEDTALTKIYNATAKLIIEKEYNKINNSDIIREAGISRSTFYIYFKNKDQIFIHICDDIFNHIFEPHLKKEKHHDFSNENPEELRHLVIHSFYHFLEDKELILAILNSGASSIFLSQLRKRIKPLIDSLINKRIIGNNDIPFEIRRHQYINGYTSLLQYYLRHGEDISPEEISSYYFNIYK